MTQMTKSAAKGNWSAETEMTTDVSKNKQDFSNVISYNYIICTARL